MDHLGIDVHKKDSQICPLAEGGELIEPRIRTEPERFAAVLGPRPRARILIEASTDREWVARGLKGLGHEGIVADPNVAPMYATRTRTVKTDRRDARAVADACRLGADRPAHRRSDLQRHVRGRVLVRDAVVRTRTRDISLIRALLRQPGSRVPSGRAEAFVSRVAVMPWPGRQRSIIAPRLAGMRPLNTQLVDSDGVIERITAADGRVRRVRTAPRVGPVTAAAVVATIDDVQRVRHAHQVQADLSMVPRERSSGESRLADEARYAEWHALWTDDGVYRVPTTTDPNVDPDAQISHIYDNRNRIVTRVKLLQTGYRFSQLPASPMRQLISNIEVDARRWRRAPRRVELHPR